MLKIVKLSTFCKIEFTKILLLSETYQRSFGGRHAWSETHSKTSTCFIGDWHTPLETTCLIVDPFENLDMLHGRLTYPIGDRHAWSETDMPAESNRNVNTFKYSYLYICTIFVCMYYICMYVLYLYVCTIFVCMKLCMN